MGVWRQAASFIDSYARCLDGLSEVGDCGWSARYQFYFPAKERFDSLGQVHVRIKDSSFGKLREGDNKIEVTGFRSESARCSGAKQVDAHHVRARSEERRVGKEC